MKMISEMISVLSYFAEHKQMPSTGTCMNGKTSSAGADLNWMRKQLKWTIQSTITVILKPFQNLHA